MLYCRNEGDNNLAEPEFKGLWETKQTPKVRLTISSHLLHYTTFQAEDGKTVQKHSKMEDVSLLAFSFCINCQILLCSQEILQTTLGKLRQNIVKKQIAAGREFKVRIPILLIFALIQSSNCLQGIPFRSKPEEIIFKVFQLELRM